MFAAHVRDLAALILGATRDAREVCLGRGVRAARLQAIKSEISRHLGRCDLSAQWVAHNQGLSASYVQKLFHAEKTTFSHYVLELRLARAYEALRAQRHQTRKISEIAFETGFGDLSYFNRAFRGRYGGTPSEVRAAAHRPPRS